MSVLKKRKKKELKKFLLGSYLRAVENRGVIYWEIANRSLSMEFFLILRSPADGRRNQFSTRLQKPLPKVDKGSLGRVYEALGGVLMSSTFLTFLLTISVGVV